MYGLVTLNKLLYHKTYEKLTGLKHRYEVSFVSHYMFFETSILKEMKKHIEKHTNLTFKNSIISLIPTKENSYFSEYETYANYSLQKQPKTHKLRYWFNISINKRKDTIETLIERYKKNYKSISFHSYNE